MAAARAIIRAGAILFFLLTLCLCALSQGSFLSKRITLDIPECSLEVALEEIGKAAGFSFSYDADLIPADKQVSLKVINTQVGALLEDMLGRGIRPKEIGNHVILVRSREEAREKQAYPDITISGIILDASNREPIREATVFQVEYSRSAISADDGRYRLIIPTGRKVMSLTYCKAGYRDTVIFIGQDTEIQVSVLLRPIGPGLTRITPIPGAMVPLSIDSLAIVNWMVPRETMINVQNIEVRSSRVLQFSAIPALGSNGRVSGSLTNRFSINLLAGYNGGVKGVELGGLLNINRNHMTGFQLGGFGNIVGGRSKGMQVGGLFNFDLGRFEGLQMAGLLNYIPDTLHGCQLTLGANIATGRCEGWQLALLCNVAKKDVRKVQAAGLANYARNVYGVQISSVLNIARNHNDGAQIALVMNYATIVNGLQLGLINISNTIERGIPIGIFSYVQEGYHPVEISGNEIFYGNAAFKSGTRNFYNIVQFGVGGDYKMQIAYGLGTIFKLVNKLSANLDASAAFVYHPTGTVYHGLLLKLSPALDLQFAKHFAVFLGPTLNYYLFPKDEPNATDRGLSQYDFYFRSTQNASIQMWIGISAGVRL
jgi:hypothetical protein